MKVCTACGVEYGDEVLFCQRDGTPLRPSNATTDLVGQVIADRYHIQKKLGEGGMGQVYLAEHVKMGRRCAIKIMTPGLVTDPDAISRFNREAANASRIGHPNVCAIYDFGETPEGLIYLAMEFIEGRSLSALLEEQGTLPLARAASIMTQCADALQVAHDLGIVHRDLKPDNIMVTTSRGRDTVKVVDFGIAKAVGAEGGSQKVTKTGFVVGTPEYMSPEQLAGDPVDGRSDLYSLALVFYRMLTGGSPFPADSQQETMIKRLTDDPLPLAEARPDVRFPPELQRVMDRALARTPADRYPTAQELGRDVRALAGSLTGAVDVEAGTQVVRADELKGTVPATRVDAQAARQKPPAPAAAPAASPARRSIPLVPAAIAVVVLATAGGLFAMRDRVFGGARSDSTQSVVPPPPQDGNGGGLTPADSGQRTSPVDGGQQAGPVNGGQTNLRNPADTGRGRPNPPRDSVIKPVGELPAPDYAALARQLDAYDGNPDFVDSDRERLAGKKLGEQIFELTGAPTPLRATAASVVGQAHIKEQDRDSAVLWMRRAVTLDPSRQSWKQILSQLEGQ